MRSPEADADMLEQIKRETEEYLKTSEGRAEVEALARELFAGDAGDIAAYTQMLLRQRAKEHIVEESQQTTQGITRADVDEAMGYLGIDNPKPEIPLEVTVSGHEIVAVARRFQRIEEQLGDLRNMLAKAGFAV